MLLSCRQMNLSLRGNSLVVVRAAHTELRQQVCASLFGLFVGMTLGTSPAYRHVTGSVIVPPSVL